MDISSKFKRYSILKLEGVEKNIEEDSDSLYSDDTDIEDLEKAEETSKIDKVTPEENTVL